jgi:hypothetical protein
MCPLKLHLTACQFAIAVGAEAVADTSRLSACLTAHDVLLVAIQTLAESYMYVLVKRRVV